MATPHPQIQISAITCDEHLSADGSGDFLTVADDDVGVSAGVAVPAEPR